MTTVALNRAEWTRIQAHFEAKRAWRLRGDGALADMPQTICLAVNNYCFMRCAMCDVGQSVKDKGLREEGLFFFQRQTGREGAFFLPLDAIKSLIDDVAPARPTIRANFLEPLIRDDICDIAEYTRGRGLDFYIITNGYLLPKRAHDLVRAGTRSIRVSMDGPREVHNRIRGLPDSFDNTLSGLALVVEEKKRRGLDFPLLGVCLTIQDANHDRLLDFYRELHASGLAAEVYVAFNHLKYNTEDEATEQNRLYPQYFALTKSSLRGTDLSHLNSDVVFEQIAAIRAEFPGDQFKYHFNPLLATRAEMREWYDPNAWVRPDATCHVPWIIAQVFYDGSVGINGRCVSPSFGNILEKPFSEVWNSAEAQQFRRTLVQAPQAMPACNRCNRHFGTEA